MNSTVQSAGSQFSAMRSTTCLHRRRHRGRLRLQVLVELEPGRMLAGGRDHQQPQAGPGLLGIDLLDDLQRIADVGAAPAQPGLGDLEVAAGRRLAAAHADAGGLHVEEAAALVLAQHAGDVVVDHDHLVDMVLPLRREHADGGRAAADPHALLARAVDDRRPVGLHHDGRAAVDRELDRLLVAEREQRVAGDDALLLAAAGQVMHAAERQHLRAVLGGGDVADRLALDPHRRLLGAEIAVGVDLHLDAAVAEDALGHDGDHVDAVMLGRDDERRGLVVGIGRGGADAGDEGALALAELARPGRAALDEGDARQIGLGQQHQRIDPHQLAVHVGVAVAGAGAARPDAAQHRAGIAAHDAGDRARPR